VYIGIDDTDTRGRMCTTYVIYQIVKELHKSIDIIGYPCLVRLNPNIPWKTRGNGAVCIRVGKGCGKKIKIGFIEGEEIYAYERSYGNPPQEIIKEVYEIVESLREKSSDTGLIFCDKKPKERFYYTAVRDVIDKIPDIPCTNFFWNKGRGLIGAYASLAWRGRKKTYECLAYLPQELWHIDRDENLLDVDLIKCLEKKYPSLFDCYDYENEYIVMLPRSKTPVLYGVRGTNAEDCLNASLEVMKKCKAKIDGILLFKTNQGTDDHIVKKKISEIKDYNSVRVVGKVSEKPKIIRGGHVIVKIRDNTGEIECAAYEPTKNFRNVIMNLVPGDVVEVYGGVCGYPNTINLEKIKIIKLVDKVERNPICKKCGIRMESLGKNKGYRCPRCGKKSKGKVLEKISREINIGIYEVPPAARRHLSRPFKIDL